MLAPRGRHIFITGRKKNSAEAAPAFLVVDVSYWPILLKNTPVERAGTH
jgi:hypothetical protein